MSGGSYNYLCRKEIDDLLYAEEDITKMAERLEEIGYAPDAAQATRDFLTLVQAVKAQLEERAGHLNGIWHVVEWWDSGDMAEDGFRFELERWREKPAPMTQQIPEEVNR